MFNRPALANYFNAFALICTRDPLLIVGEVTDWQGHSPERLKEMKDNIACLKEMGIEVIED